MFAVWPIGECENFALYRDNDCSGIRYFHGVTVMDEKPLWRVLLGEGCRSSKQRGCDGGGNDFFGSL